MYTINIVYEGKLPVQNPFAPGAGTQPPELAGRNSILDAADIALQRLKGRRPSRSFILVGLRGVGKTVLLNRIREMAQEQGYYALLIEAHEEKSLPALLIPPLRKILLQLDRQSQISDKTKRALRVLRSFMSRFQAKLKVGELGEIELGIEPETGTADSGDLEMDLGDLLLSSCRSGHRKKYICLSSDR